jgi:hypothetical protein
VDRNLFLNSSTSDSEPRLTQRSSVMRKTGGICLIGVLLLAGAGLPASSQNQQSELKMSLLKILSSIIATR